jgi:hypothetical protein
LIRAGFLDQTVVDPYDDFSLAEEIMMMEVSE